MEERGLFGMFLKKHMTSKQITLRELARRTSIDPGNLSRIERGIAYPPQKEETLIKIALGLKLTDMETQELIDKAFIENGKLPKNLKHVKEIEAIPLLLRSIENKKLTEEQIENLIEIIKDENTWQGRIIE